MELKGHWRHELKYEITYADYLSLRQRLRAVMQPDSHVCADGTYKIRSIYFDNPDDKALREKLSGVQTREKFRIRWYNDDLSTLALEKKLKHNSLCNKTQTAITEAECRALLSGELGWMKSHSSELLHELYFKMNQQQLSPRVTVSYLREPYVYAPGNVRVTFDWDIRTSLFHRELLSAPSIAAASPEHRILEVKYDEYLPDIIVCLLQEAGIRQQAFSKYAACRRFG